MLLLLLWGCSQGCCFYLFSPCTAKFQWFEAGREGLGRGGLVPLSGNTNFLLPAAFAHTLLGGAGGPAEPGDCRVS